MLRAHVTIIILFLRSSLRDFSIDLDITKEGAKIIYKRYVTRWGIEINQAICPRIVRTKDDRGNWFASNDVLDLLLLNVNHSSFHYSFTIYYIIYSNSDSEVGKR